MELGEALARRSVSLLRSRCSRLRSDREADEAINHQPASAHCVQGKTCLPTGSRWSENIDKQDKSQRSCADTEERPAATQEVRCGGDDDGDQGQRRI